LGWKILEDFFGRGGKLKKKYHLVRWEKNCKAKKNRGLGFKDLRRMNMSLLCKWWWLLETGSGLWKDIVNLKYVKQDPICSIPTECMIHPSGSI
jgi:hypothetical protein